jgi:hypothetical protein
LWISWGGEAETVHAKVRHHSASWSIIRARHKEGLKTTSSKDQRFPTATRGREWIRCQWAVDLKITLVFFE